MDVRIVRVAHHAVMSAWRERERLLRRNGADLRLLSAQRWNEGGRLVDLAADGDEFVEGVRTIGSHPNGFLYDPRPIWRMLRRRPELIDLHEEPFALATAEVLFLRRLLGLRTPYVLYSAQNIDKRYPWPIRWFEKRALQGAAGAYVCNVEAGVILRRKGLRGPARLIPLGVDTARFQPHRRRAPRKNPTIGYIGRLEPYKGVDVLLRAAAKHPNWRIRITGDGPARADLVALARELGVSDRVEILGFADGEALAERYRELDVIAVPSIPWPGWLEQFCRVAVEAMASGVPVVASRTGAIPDVVGDTGVLVEPGEPAALAEGLSQALSPETWKRLRSAGPVRAREFTWDRVAQQQIDLYREVVADASSGRDRVPQVVVVAYGEPDLLEGALDAIGGDYPVTIVDNSSSSRTREIAAERRAHYIDPGRNLGFAAGVNTALRSLAERGLSGDDVLLLNPDARIDAAGVTAMQRRLHSGARIAAVGASQVDPATGERARVWWPFPSPVRAWVEAVGLGRLNRARDFAIGSILLLRAEAVRAVGLLDERFFLYAEEVDWQRRARDAGWTIEVIAVDATHIGAGTGGDSTRREQLFHASAERYVRKHFGGAGWAVYRAALIAGSVARGFVLPGARGRAARLRAELYLRGPVAVVEQAS